MPTYAPQLLELMAPEDYTALLKLSDKVAPMTQEDIARVRTVEPRLTSFGIGIYRDLKQSPAQRREAFDREVAELLKSVFECTAIYAWLAPAIRRQTINRARTSYGLKHTFSGATGLYVTNGMFIAAAIHSGLRYKSWPNFPNVCFNLSQRWEPMRGVSL